jgi:valyl-tRNA synthetase
LIDTEADTHISWLQRVVSALRTLRSEMNIAPGKQLSILLRQGTAQDRAYFKKHEAFICSLAKIAGTRWLDEAESAPESAIALAGTLEMLVPMADFIDRDAENERLTREIGKLTIDIGKIRKKLENPDFVARAPEAVVSKEKQLLGELEARCARLQEQLAVVCK